MNDPKFLLMSAVVFSFRAFWYNHCFDTGRCRKSFAAAAMLRRHRYGGYVSLEFEGREDPRTAVPRSLALLRKAFA